MSVQIKVKSERLTELVSASKAMAEAIGEYDKSLMFSIVGEDPSTEEVTAFRAMLRARERFVAVSRGEL